MATALRSIQVDANRLDEATSKQARQPLLKASLASRLIHQSAVTFTAVKD